MNEKNLEYLKKLLENLGFGKKLHDVLEAAIRSGKQSFTIGIATKMRPAESKDVNDPRTEHLDFRLNFNRSTESDMYFLNTYNVALTKNGDPIVREQTFDLTRDHWITVLQAYKLLSGLSFEKEIYPRSKNENVQTGDGQQQKIPVWFKLSLDITDAYGNHPLRTFRPEYGYDLAETIGRYPFKELDTPEKLQQALTTLRNGNYYHGQMIIGKKSVPVSVGANPQIKNLDVFDKNMIEIRDDVIFPERAKAKKAEQEQAKDIDQDTKQEQQVEQPWVQEPEQEISNKRGR